MKSRWIQVLGSDCRPEFDGAAVGIVVDGEASVAIQAALAAPWLIAACQIAYERISSDISDRAPELATIRAALTRAGVSL